jgi:hypothetical protein
MAGILDLLGSDLGKQIISGVAGSTGAPTNKTADLLGMALPVLMGAIQKNASTTGWCRCIFRCCDEKKT